MEADEVIFLGSPGVGVDSAAQLRVAAGHVWSSTSRSDVIQYAAVSPRGLADELTRAGFGVASPQRHLWFGENPSDPSFGARVFGSRPDGGHLGYGEPGSPSLDGLAAITLGRNP
jgi:hypothetical protein